MASARENSNLSSGILHYERFSSIGVQGSFGSNVPDSPLSFVARRRYEAKVQRSVAGFV